LARATSACRGSNQTPLNLFRLAIGFLLLNGILPDVVADGPDHHITQGEIGKVGNLLEHLLIVRGNANCHDSVAFLGHTGEVTE